MEKATIWGFTEEEIDRRWKIHNKFDPITRLFGSSDSQDNKAGSPAIDAPKVNPDQLMSALEQLLSPGD